MLNSKQSLLVLCALTMVNGKIFCAADQQPDSKERFAREGTYCILFQGKHYQKCFNLRLRSGTLFPDGETTNLCVKDHTEKGEIIFRHDGEQYTALLFEKYLKIGDVRVDETGASHILFINKRGTELEWVTHMQQYARFDADEECDMFFINWYELAQKEENMQRFAKAKVMRAQAEARLEGEDY